MSNFQAKTQAYSITSAVAQGSSFTATLIGMQRAAAMLLVAAALLCLPSLAVSQDGPSAGVQRAYSFLQDRQNAANILSFVHFGADLDSYEYLRSESVTDRNGNQIDGDFALVYRFHWQDDGLTDIAFLCKPSGQIYESQVVSTNAVLNQPFMLANLSIQVVGRLVVNSDNRMSDSDRQLALDLIDKADAHGLLDLWLALQ